MIVVDQYLASALISGQSSALCHYIPLKVKGYLKKAVWSTHLMGCDHW